jgi:hypothetical protein
MRIWLGADISDGLIDAVDGIGLLVRDLDAEFLLDRHDHLDRVEAVQAEVVAKVRGCVDLGFG